MPLIGSLSTFPPSEIFQFLSQSRKTGTLRVYEKTETKLLSFVEGKLRFAVHSRGTLPVTELILYRNLAGPDEVAEVVDHQHLWNAIVGRAQARRRLSNKPLDSSQIERRTSGVWRSPSRIGAILVAQGSIREEDMKRILTPGEIPAAMLESMFRGSPLGKKAATRSGSFVRSGDTPLHESLVKAGLVSREELDEMISWITDESLAELLVYHELIGKTEVRRCLEQLEKLRQSEVCGIRFGTFLVAKGKISQRQLERALEAQLLEGGPVGEILVAQGALDEANLKIALEELEDIRADFGLLYALREKLIANGMVTRQVFRDLVREVHPQETLCDAFVRKGILEAAGLVSDAVLDVEAETRAMLGSVVKDVIVDEICDLLLWKDASFEFFEGFSLEDAFGRETLPPIHDGTFEVNALLLDAHSAIDELRTTHFGEIKPSTIYIEIATDDVPDEHHAVLRGITGTRPLRDLKRVLPGNHFAHLCMFSNLAEQGLIRPLTRDEAAGTGLEAAKNGRSKEASDLLEHALTQPGTGPSDATLRATLYDLRLQAEPRFHRIAMLRVRSWLRRLGETRACRAVTGWVERSPRAQRLIAGARSSCTSTVAVMSRGCMAIPRLCSKVRSLVETFLIRVGLARHLWSFEAKYLRPVQVFLDNHGFSARNRRIVYMLGIFLFALVVVSSGPGEVRPLLPTTHEIVPDRYVAHATSSRIDVPPCLSDDHIYVCTRDGELRSLQIVPRGDDARAELRPRWQLEIGEFGDILTEPAVYQGAVFVANVRGDVLCISDRGKSRWSKNLPRAEPIRPALITAGDGGLLGVAVAAMNEVLVLDPKDGGELFRFATGNRIVCAPASRGNLLVIGSSDNHIYGVDWKDGLLLWEHEGSDDVTSVLLADDRAVFASRDGHVSAVDLATGKMTWRNIYARNSIRWLGRLDTGRICVGTTTGQTHTLRSAGGEKLASFAATVSRSTCAAGRILFSEPEAFVAVTGDGRVQWRMKLPLDVSEWVVRGDTLLTVNEDGKLGLFPLPTNPGGGR